jgi:O-antigen/teichoic acid export membrane protein
VVLYGLRGADETAPYAAAVRVLDVAGVLGVIAFSAVAPVFSRAHQSGDVEVWRLWRRYVTRMAAVVIPVAVVLAVAARPLASLLFGVRYAEDAGTDLALLAPAAAVFVLISISSVVLYMDDRSAGLIRLTALNLAVNLVLTVSLTALWGHHGTAAAVSMGELVSFCGFAFVIVRRHGLGSGSPGPARA